MNYLDITAGDRIAVDPVYSNINRPPRFGVVLRIGGPREIVVLYDGSTSPSNIDPRIVRALKEGES